MKKKSAYCHKGLLIEIFRKEAESQNNRNPKCYNNAAMKKHQQIAKESIGFAPRPMSAQEWEKFKKRQLALKSKKETK
jgi:hypothetical protein